MQPITLFWTGGWDSTYRLCDVLLVERRTVRTHYVASLKRSSLAAELRAMARIRAHLLPRLPPGADFPPTVITMKQHLSNLVDRRLLASARRLRDNGAHVGMQYPWLHAAARLHALHEPEICLEWREGTALREQAFTIDWAAEPPSVRLLDTEMAEVFRGFAFPTLHLTKAQMRERAREQGFEDVLGMTWFCHTPVRGLACGRCVPCTIARATDVHRHRRFIPAPERLVRDAGRTMAGLARRTAGRIRIGVRATRPRAGRST